MKVKVINSDVSKAYDEMSDSYVNVVDTKPFNAYYERPSMFAMIRRTGDLKGKKILEPGCASGWYTEQFLKEKAEVIAFDISENMVNYTKKRVNNKAKVLKADICKPLDFVKDYSIDLIVCSLMLHYAKDWNNIFKEFYKKLKPEGEIVFSTHHPFNSYFKPENYYETKVFYDMWEINGEKFKIDYYLRPLQAMINPILTNNFNIEEIREARPTLDFKKALPEKYEKVRKNPHFLLFRVKKYI